MNARKGSLMSVRNDIKVLDATIRDGGLCNNFNFSDEFVTELYKMNVRCGTDYMEFGYKASRSMFKESDFGNSVKRKISALLSEITLQTLKSQLWLT